MHHYFCNPHTGTGCESKVCLAAGHGCFAFLGNFKGNVSNFHGHKTSISSMHLSTTTLVADTCSPSVLIFNIRQPIYILKNVQSKLRSNLYIAAAIIPAFNKFMGKSGLLNYFACESKLNFRCRSFANKRPAKF
jgi:hypothetical protein